MEEGLPGASEASAARRGADESRPDVREDSAAAEGKRVSEAAARDLKKSYEHTGRGTEPRYAMIEQLSVEFGIKECCQALVVSRSGYNQWLKSEPSQREKEDAEFAGADRQSF